MRIYNYNKEKPDNFKSNLYIKAVVFGIIVALIFIGSGKLLMYLLDKIVKYWIWVIIIFLAAWFVKHLIFKNKRNILVQDRIG